MICRAPLGLLLAAFSLFTLGPATFAEETESENEPVVFAGRGPSLFVFGLGPSYWPSAHDIDPSGSPYAEYLGRFHTWGLNLEFAYQRRMARLRSGELLFGGDFGLVANENSKEIESVIFPFGDSYEGTLTVRVLYLTTGARFVFYGSSRWRFSLGGGAGYYEADIAELFEDGFEAAELFSESTLGGYLSFGADRRLWGGASRWRLRLEQKIHFADFGSTDSYAPDSGELTGPINTLLIGFVFDP